jgi:hypothetical protein
MPLLILSVLTPQSVRHYYVVFWSLDNSTILKSLQEAADRGYRLVPDQGKWPLVVLEKVTGDVEPIDYLLLGTRRAATMQKEMNEASAQGYRFASMLGVPTEFLIAMQRDRGKVTRTHEQKILATRRLKTLQTELSAEVQNGFHLVGHLQTASEFWAVLERPFQSATKHKYLLLDEYDVSQGLQKVVDRGYLLIPEQAWISAAIFEEATSDAGSIEYLVVKGRGSETLQKRMNEASAQGYRFVTFHYELGPVMEREKGKATRTHEYKILKAIRYKNLEKEVLAEVQKGFRIAAMQQGMGEGTWVIMEGPD